MQDSGSYQQKAIPLTGGLDLTSPRMLVDPGRLVDVLNYECVDTDGYKRIDGYERYDGGISPSSTGGYYFTTNAANDDQAAWETSTNLHVGSLAALYYDVDGTVTPITIAAIEYVEIEPGYGYWKVTFDSSDPSSVDSLIDTLLTNNNIYVFDSPIAPTTVTSIVEYDGGLGLYRTALSLSTAIANADVTRGEIDALPQDQWIYGLHLYKDALHVLADCRYLYFAFDAAAFSPQPAVTAREFFPGNVFRVGGSGGFEGRILGYEFLRGGFLAENTTLANRSWIKVLVYPTVPNGTLTTATTVNIDRVNATYTDPASVSCWMYYWEIDANGPTDSTPVWGAVLYKGLEEFTTRTADNAWTQIDMGYEISFDNGDSVTEPKELTLATTQEELDATSVTKVGFPYSEADSFVNIHSGFIDSNADILGGDTDSVTLASGNYDLETDEGSPNQTGVYARRADNRWGDGTGVFFKNFGLEVPQDAIIRGVVVEATCWYASSTGGTNDSKFTTVRLTPPDDLAGNAVAPSDNRGGANTSDTVSSSNPAAPNTFTYGSASDTWGLTLTPDIVNDPEFTLEMTPSVGAGGSSAVVFLMWAKLNVTVYYYIPAGKLFFYDQTDSVEAKLVRVGLDTGSWANGDAKGTAHVYGLVPSATRNYIKVGDKLRLAAAGTDIGTVTGVKGAFLPSHTTFVASDRRVEIVKANFSLNPEWETLYGVTGLGRAWSYDGTYFRKIYTEYDASLDKPTHLCSYRNYLVLGFNSGNLLISAISGDKGPRPEEFRATEGAREFVFIDPIHGLSELADTSLGVFCRSSINRLVFNANAADADGLFYQAVISPNSGCIEYTLASFGDNTLYCDQYGIRTVEQTDVYGDLVAKPLSYPVSSWIRPRLSGKKYWRDSRPSVKPLFAHTVKAKNQYRVWFDDGFVLCMNLNSTEAPPQFTFLQYGYYNGSTFYPLCPVAYSNSTDNEVTERIHVAHWNRQQPSTSPVNGASTFKYAFELERGWSFDGVSFPARLTVNLSLLESPFNFDNVRKAELHGLDYGNTTMFCGWGTKYSEELSYTGLSLGDTFTPAGRNAVGEVSTEYIPFSKVIQTASRGRPLLMKLKNTTTATGTTTYAIETPHVLQAVLVQYIPLRNEG